MVSDRLPNGTFNIIRLLQQSDQGLRRRTGRGETCIWVVRNLEG